MDAPTDTTDKETNERTNERTDGDASLCPSVRSFLSYMEFDTIEFEDAVFWRKKTATLLRISKHAVQFAFG